MSESPMLTEAAFAALPFRGMSPARRVELARAFLAAQDRDALARLMARRYRDTYPRDKFDDLPPPTRATGTARMREVVDALLGPEHP
jgi:hypothetical protein